MSTLTIWIAVVASALCTGAFIAAVLVVRQRAEPLAVFAAAAAFGASIYFITSVAGLYNRIDALLYALAFFVAASGAGYSLASSLLGLLAHRPEVPQVPQVPDRSTGPAAIIVCCHEPEHYSPAATASLLKSLEDEGLFTPATGSLPFLFFAQKARYRAVGGTSASHKQLTSLAEKAAASLSSVGNVQVYSANCSGKGRLAARVAEAVAAGHTDIVVVELGVGRSLQLSAAEQEVDAMKLDALGITVTYTEPVGDSDLIITALSRRLTAGAEASADRGVVLVGHGQPESRSKLDPAFDEQETVFLNRIRQLVVEAGLPMNNVRIAWSDWRDPDVTSAVRHLAALGCSNITVIPATSPLDGIATRLDLEIATSRSRVRESVTVVTMSGWQDDDSVVAEVRERIVASLPKE